MLLRMLCRERASRFLIRKRLKTRVPRTEHPATLFGLRRLQSGPCVANAVVALQGS